MQPFSIQTAAALMLMSLATTHALAIGEPSVPDYIPGTCIVDAQDPYEPNLRMDDGPLKGLCISPVQRRSVDMLPEATAKNYFDVRTGDVVIANFSHQGKFWLARIPVASAEKVLLQTEYFPIVTLPVIGAIHIAHIQFRFQFKNGEKILLKPQTRETGLQTAATELSDMIFSVENIGPFGEKFDSKKGFKGHYHLAYRAISVADKYKWMITDQGHLVSQSGIKFSAAQTSKLLQLGLEEGEKYGTGREYHTLNPNCSTELFVLLDRVTGTRLFSHPSLPNSAINALKTRRLLDKKKIPSLNEEFKQGQP